MLEFARFAHVPINFCKDWKYWLESQTLTSFSLTCLASSNFLLSKSKIILRWKSSHISKEDACWRTYPPDRLVYRMLWSVLWSSSTTCAFLQKKGFNGKYEMDVIDRYRRIKKILNNKTLSAMAYAVIFYAQNLKNFTIPLQSTQPMITVLHSKMVKLVKELLSSFHWMVVLLLTEQFYYFYY